MSFCHSDLQEVQSNMQKTLNLIAKWIQENGFRVFTLKTVAMHFQQRQQIVPSQSSIIGGNEISYTASTKFLGLTFDSKLTWRHHIMNLKANCQKRLEY